MKIVLEWDVDCTVKTPEGMYVGTLADGAKYALKNATADATAPLIALKNAGFTVDEIVTLDQRGLLPKVNG